jgi:hypothetical protein
LRPCEPGEANDPDFGRPITAPLEPCAELLGVDLAAIGGAGRQVESYIRSDIRSDGISGLEPDAA